MKPGTKARRDVENDPRLRPMRLLSSPVGKQVRTHLHRHVSSSRVVTILSLYMHRAVTVPSRVYILNLPDTDLDAYPKGNHVDFPSLAGSD